MIASKYFIRLVDWS